MVIPMFSPLFPLLLLLLSFLSLLWYQKTDNDIFKALAVSSFSRSLVNSPAGTAVIVKIQNPRFQFGARA